MPDIAVEMTLEDDAKKGTEDDVMSDEEDEIRLRQVRIFSGSPSTRK